MAVQPVTILVVEFEIGFHTLLSICGSRGGSAVLGLTLDFRTQGVYCFHYKKGSTAHFICDFEGSPHRMIVYMQQMDLKHCTAPGTLYSVTYGALVEIR